MRSRAQGESTSMVDVQSTNGHRDPSSRAFAASAAHGAVELDDKKFYINREISWLAFNERVLAEGRDPRWPLLERLKFLAIHGSNLDEFFMIRVSGLHEQLVATVTDPTPDGLGTREQLVAIRQLVLEQVEQAAALLSTELLPALASKG